MNKIQFKKLRSDITEWIYSNEFTVSNDLKNKRNITEN